MRCSRGDGPPVVMPKAWEMRRMRVSEARRSNQDRRGESKKEKKN